MGHTYVGYSAFADVDHRRQRTAEFSYIGGSGDFSFNISCRIFSIWFETIPIGKLRDFARLKS